MELYYSSMYKALKSAQNEIQESLLKFADEVSAFDKKLQNQCPRGDPCRCAFLTQGVSSPAVEKQTQSNEMVDMLQKTLHYMIEKQNSQYAVLVHGIQELNVSLKNIANILITQSEKQEQVITASIIPNIQPVSQDSDLKTVCVLGMEDSDCQSDELNIAVDLESVNEAQLDIDNEEEVEEEQEEEDEQEEQEDEQDNHPTDVNLNDVNTADNSEEQEEEIELEEWTYKGRVFFKDSNNTVYANNLGEIGDPIGQYDSVKNIVRPLKN